MYNKKFYTITISDDKFAETKTIIAGPEFKNSLDKMISKAIRRGDALLFLKSVVGVFQKT